MGKCKTYERIIMPFLLFNRAIKREEEKSLENSLTEAIADSSTDMPVLPKPGKLKHLHEDVSL